MNYTKIIIPYNKHMIIIFFFTNMKSTKELKDVFFKQIEMISTHFLTCTSTCITFKGHTHIFSSVT